MEENVQNLAPAGVTHKPDTTISGVAQSHSSNSGTGQQYNVTSNEKRQPHMTPTVVPQSSTNPDVGQQGVANPVITPPQYMTTAYTNPTYSLGAPQTNQPQIVGPPEVIVIAQPKTTIDSKDLPLYYQCAFMSAGCCFIPIGIVAVVFAHLAYRRSLAGDRQGKHRYMKVSKFLTMTSCLLGLACYITVIIIYASA